MNSIHIPTVIIADYSKDTRDILKYWLEMKGCRVVEATNGQDAVELTRGECPDLVLMSLTMPVLGGLDATRRIREPGSGCFFPIVAMSTYPTREAKESAIAAGCASFIAQPIDFDALGILLNSLLPVSTADLHSALIEM